MNMRPEWAGDDKKPGRPSKYGLSTMRINEVKSYSPEFHGNRTLTAFRNYLYNQAARLGYKFASRQLPDGTIEVCRLK